jgi:hypothetical protein
MAAHPGPVIVTGANSGIGLASVLRFAERGWDAWEPCARGQGRGARRRRGRGLCRARASAGARRFDHAAVVDAWKDRHFSRS